MQTTHAREVCGIQGIGSLYAYSCILLASITSIIGNIIVILSIVKYASLRKPPVSLFGVLSALHFLVSCIIIPVNIKVTLQNTTVCYDSFWWMFIIVSLTLATLAHITFDQYARIHYLDKYIPSVKKLFAGLLGCYVPPFVFTFIGLQRIAGALVACALFFLYITSIIGCYVAMLVALRNHRSILNTDARERCIDRERRSATNLMVVVLLYIITHTPALLYIVLMLLGKHSPPLYIISMFTVGANSALNPIVYFLRMSAMRKYMLRLLGLERVNEKAKATLDDRSPPPKHRVEWKEKEVASNVPRSCSMDVSRHSESPYGEGEGKCGGSSLRRQNSAPPMRVRWETDV